jgi:membrane associated rhomboid family serine protease
MDPQNKLPATPATLGLAASWIFVFLAMIAYQGGLQTGGNIISTGISPWSSHPFGDLTSRELMSGQFWKPLTATFIHYSIPHILFNLVGLYQLGRLVESWYGSAQFLGLYVVIGYFGNLLAGLSKPFLAWALHPWFTLQVAGASGGGSGVLCGLIAMLAVVGWRSKSRYGDYLKGQMVGVLIFTAILGIVIPHIDNFGHAGGAIVGGLCGFLDPLLLRRAEQPRKSRWIGVVSVLAIVAAFGLQWNLARSETLNESQGIRMLEQGVAARSEALKSLPRLGILFRALSLRGPKDIVIDRSPPIPGRRAATRSELAAGAEAITKHLERIDAQIDDEQISQSLKTLVSLTRHAETRRPTPGEIALFDRHFVTAATRIQQEQASLNGMLQQVRRVQAERDGPAKQKPPLGGG